MFNYFAKSIPLFPQWEQSTVAAVLLLWLAVRGTKPGERSPLGAAQTGQQIRPAYGLYGYLSVYAMSIARLAGSSISMSLEVSAPLPAEAQALFGTRGHGTPFQGVYCRQELLPKVHHFSLNVKVAFPLQTVHTTVS